MRWTCDASLTSLWWAAVSEVHLPAPSAPTAVPGPGPAEPGDLRGRAPADMSNTDQYLVRGCALGGPSCGFTDLHVVNLQYVSGRRCP